MAQFVNITPIQTGGRDIGKLTIAEMHAVYDFIHALAPDAPELTQGKAFELDGRVWELCLEVVEE